MTLVYLLAALILIQLLITWLFAAADIKVEQHVNEALQGKDEE